MRPLSHVGYVSHPERGLRQNNRAENSHVAVRRRERKMRHFRSIVGSEILLGTCFYYTFNIWPRLHRSVPRRSLRRTAHRCARCSLKRHSAAISSTEPCNVTNLSI